MRRSSDLPKINCVTAAWERYTPPPTRDAADARAESDKVASEETARTTFDTTVFTAQADFQDAATNAEEARADAQADALRTYEQAASEAALDKATDQAAADATAATAGAGTLNRPDAEQTPDDPEDIAARSLTGGTMAVLDPADSGPSGQKRRARVEWYAKRQQLLEDRGYWSELMDKHMGLFEATQDD